MNKTYPIFALFVFGGGGGGKIFGIVGFVPFHVLESYSYFQKCAQYVSNVLYVFFLTPYDLSTIPFVIPNIPVQTPPMVVPNSSTFYSIFLAQNPTLLAHIQEPNLKGQ